MLSPCPSYKAPTRSKRSTAGSRRNCAAPEFDVVSLGNSAGNAVDALFSQALSAGISPEQLAKFQPSRCVHYAQAQETDCRQLVEDKGFQFRTTELRMETQLNQLPSADVYMLWYCMERLSSKLEAQRVLLAALSRARTMVWLRFPSFQPDAVNGEGVLRDRGLRFAWTEWPEHPTPWLLQDCQKTLELWRTQEPERAYAAKLRPSRILERSNSFDVLPVAAPASARKYHIRLGRKPKPPIHFPRRVAAEWDVIIQFQS